MTSIQISRALVHLLSAWARITVQKVESKTKAMVFVAIKKLQGLMAIAPAYA